MSENDTNLPITTVSYMTSPQARADRIVGIIDPRRPTVRLLEASQIRHQCVGWLRYTEQREIAINAHAACFTLIYEYK